MNHRPGNAKILILLAVVAAGVLGAFALYAIPRPAPSTPPVYPAEGEAAPVTPLATYLDPVRGAAKARVTVIEFGDYDCPYCGAVEATLAQLLAAHPDVRLVWKSFPLPTHPNAQGAAEAALCAGDQGKFWEFHDALFAHQDSLGDDLYQKIAVALKLELATFTACTENHTSAPRITKTFDDGAAAAVDGVPYFFVGTTRLSGQVSIDDFEHALKTAK
jgi:protein-disulfide isomerase